MAMLLPCPFSAFANSIFRRSLNACHQSNFMSLGGGGGGGEPKTAEAVLCPQKESIWPNSVKKTKKRSKTCYLNLRIVTILNLLEAIGCLLLRGQGGEGTQNLEARNLVERNLA